MGFTRDFGHLSGNLVKTMGKDCALFDHFVTARL